MGKVGKMAGILSLAAAVTLAGVAATAVAFNPQPDPPAFGIVSIIGSQTIRINVVCYQHRVIDVPPGPCRGVLLLHDDAGRDLASMAVDLAPGHATFLEYKPNVRVSVDAVPARFMIDPCWLPDPRSGRALPTVEVIDTATGATAFAVNPVTPRISLISHHFGDGR